MQVSVRRSVAEHDINFVTSVCQHVVVLDFGQKIDEGPLELVRNDPAVVAEGASAS